MKYLIGIVIFILMSAKPGVQAQQWDYSEKVQEKMAAFDWMLGSWEGNGWIQQGMSGREDFFVTEYVKLKLGGNVMLLNGEGTVFDMESGDMKIVHQAFATLTYDALAEEYKLRAHTKQGMYTDAEIEMKENGFDWSFDVMGQSKVRYEVRYEDGKWLEKGFFSPDKEQWFEFFSMTLTKKEDKQ